MRHLAQNLARPLEPRSLALAVFGLAAIFAATLANPGTARAARHHIDDEPDTSGMSHQHRELRLSTSGAAALEIDFGAGHLRVRRGAPSRVIVLDLYQTAGVDSPVITLDQKSGEDRVKVASGDWSVERDQGSISIHHPPDHSDSAGKDDDDEDARAHRRDRDRSDDDIHADARRVWEIRLPDDVEFTVSLASGASRSDVDLSGLKVRDLEIATGAGEMELRFDQPNPVPGGMLEIQGGACKFTAHGLGNGGFRSIRFAGGVGDFLLDFSGASRDESRAEFDLGLGKLRVEIPSSLGVKLDATGGGLAHLDVDGLDRHGDSFVSPGYERASHRLTLDISASLGVVEVVQQ